ERLEARGRARHLQPVDGEDARGARAAERRALSADQGDRARDPIAGAGAASGAPRRAEARTARRGEARTRGARASSAALAPADEAEEEAMTRSTALLVLSRAACGGGSKEAAGPATPAQTNVLPPANPQAVSKMVQGVQASKEPNGRTRAIALLKE